MTLEFDVNCVYGSTAAPETGNVTWGNTQTAKLGVMTTLFHNNAGAPTFGAQFKAMSSISAGYTNATLNIIRFQYWGPTDIWYDIQKL